MVFYISSKLKYHIPRVAQHAPSTIKAVHIAPQFITNAIRAALANIKKIELNELLSRCFTKKISPPFSSAYNVLYLTR
jgi:hypothetical protein